MTCSPLCLLPAAGLAKLLVDSMCSMGAYACTLLSTALSVAVLSWLEMRSHSQLYLLFAATFDRH